MTTEQEMQQKIGSVLWMSSDMFVGTMIHKSKDPANEIDHPGIVVKTADGSEFHIPTIRVR